MCVLALVLYTVLWWYGCHVFRICRYKNVFSCVPYRHRFLWEDEFIPKHPGNWETFQWTSNSEVPKLKGITGPQQEMGCKYFNIVMSVKQAVVYWHRCITLQNQELIPSHVTPLHRRLTYMTKGFPRTCETGRLIKGHHPTAPCRCAQGWPRIALPGRVTGHQLENKDAQGPPVHSLMKWVDLARVHGLMYQIIITKWRYIEDTVHVYLISANKTNSWLQNIYIDMTILYICKL